MNNPFGRFGCYASLLLDPLQGDKAFHLGEAIVMPLIMVKHALASGAIMPSLILAAAGNLIARFGSNAREWERLSWRHVPTWKRPPLASWAAYDKHIELGGEAVASLSYLGSSAFLFFSRDNYAVAECGMLFLAWYHAREGRRTAERAGGLGKMIKSLQTPRNG